MVKVSITLPNAAQITLESEESEVVQQVVSMVLRDLPRELMHSGADAASGNGQGDPPRVNGGIASDTSVRGPAHSGSNVVEETGISIVEPAGPPSATTSGLASGPAAATPGRSSTRASARPRRESIPSELGSQDADRRAAATRVPTGEADREFAQFCAAAAPLGDMRKVVVAAEGARRFLNMPSVDAADLAGLFDLADWPRPHNFIQTLRNAARDKYRWLERVPGRSGRYTATQLGRSVTLTE